MLTILYGKESRLSRRKMTKPDGIITKYLTNIDWSDIIINNNKNVDRKQVSNSCVHRELSGGARQGQRVAEYSSRVSYRRSKGL